jgi:hypothetical protein
MKSTLARAIDVAEAAVSRGALIDPSTLDPCNSGVSTSTANGSDKGKPTSSSSAAKLSKG